MRRLVVTAAITLGSLYACADPRSEMADVTIKQSTVGNLDGARVGVTRIGTSEEYSLPDGAKKTGTIARLAIAGGPSLTVGVGSKFSFGSHEYEVTAVEDTKPRGTVTIRRVH